MSKATLREWFGGKNIGSIMFLTEGSWNNFEDDERWSDILYHRVMTIAEAEKWLDFKFNTGFGGQDVPDFNAWSPTHVYYVHEYDGAVSMHSALRNPPEAT